MLGFFINNVRFIYINMKPLFLEKFFCSTGIAARSNVLLVLFAPFFHLPLVQEKYF